MDNRSLKALDFYALLDLLKAYATSSLGQKRCEALSPSQDLSSIRTRLAEVLELKKILETVEDLPIQGIKDIEGILKKAEIEERIGWKFPEQSFEIYIGETGNHIDGYALVQNTIGKHKPMTRPPGRRRLANWVLQWVAAPRYLSLSIDALDAHWVSLHFVAELNRAPRVPIQPYSPSGRIPLLRGCP